MAKTKTMKSMLKGVAAGFACIMCSAFFPASMVADAVENYKGATAQTNVSRIQVDGKNESLNVTEGSIVNIPSATYSFKNSEGEADSYVIGSGENASEKINSSIEVIYSGNGEKVQILSGNKFRANKVGSYVIKYTVVKDGTPYSYELNVVSKATEASFDFETNVESVIPSVYDPSITNDDVVLPIPSVKGQNDEEILSASKEEDKAYYVINSETGSLPTDKNFYVDITLTNGGESVKIQPDDAGNYVIKGSTIANKTDGKYDFEGREFKIVYALYQYVGQENLDQIPVYVASTTKTFKVKSNYYYKTTAKKEAGYDIQASFSATFPDSAVVGVEKQLPGIVATTSSTNTPASEAIQVHYDIEVYKMDENGKWGTENIKDQVVTEGNKFKANSAGSYKFVYKVDDFYGYGKNIDSDKLTRIIKNVKDTVSATAYMYDAANENAFIEEENRYESAENSFKTKTVNRNIIMYAIGGTDNNPNAEIKLRREIRNYANYPEFIVDKEEYEGMYTKYNLVFAPAVASTAQAGTSVYKQISDDNFALRSQMILAGVDITDGAKIQQYMQGKYLLVTTQFNKDVNGEEIVPGLEETDPQAREKMRDAGYAYITPEKDRTGKFVNEKEYTFYYFAKDEDNAESSLNKDKCKITVAEDYTDESIPSLTFTSDLQGSYLPTDVFSFNVASAADASEQDSRITAVTAYRFLTEDSEGKKVPLTSNITKSTLNYVVNRVSEKYEGEWFAPSGKNQEVTSEGWFVDQTADTYTVDLKKAEGATEVEILAYAIDDYGNAGFFRKVIKIADATDNDMPTLARVTNAPATAEKFTAPDEITLPTLQFSDSKASFISAEVKVYKIIRDSQTGEYKDSEDISSYAMNAKPDTERNLYTVNAGKFRASTAGEYQVAISVKDAGNHVVTSYFTYNVEEGETKENSPTIDNISSKTENVDPDAMYYLDPPSISIAKDDNYGYIGLEEDDDSNTATYYTVEAISATNNDYEIINNTYFTAGTEGTFKLKYTAYLLKYAKSALATEKTDGKLYFNEQGKLVYTKGTTDYFVYMDDLEDYAIKANTSLDGLGEDLDSDSLIALKKVVSSYVIENDSVVTLNVSGASVSIDEKSMKEHYELKTEFYVADKDRVQAGEEEWDSVEIMKPIVEKRGDTETDLANSFVTVTKGSTTLGTFYLNKWDKTEDVSLADYFDLTQEGKVILLFKDDAKYTVSYTIKATNGALGDEYSATLSAGDVIDPTIEIKDSIVKTNYKAGDTMRLNMDAIIVDDDKTTDRAALLDYLKVEYKHGTGSYTEIKNTATVDGEYDYSLALEKNGTYTLRFTVKDDAGNDVSKTFTFDVGSNETKATDAKEVVGGVLIGLSVALLAGVVAYFVISKVKLDKKEKSYRKETKSKRK